MLTKLQIGMTRMLQDRPSRIDSRLAALWCAVVYQAIDDIRGRSDMSDKYSAHQKKIRRENAKAWFPSKRTDVGSFQWICEILDFNPELFREIILATDNIGDIEKWPAMYKDHIKAKWDSKVGA